MSSTAEAILQNMVEVLQATGKFARVSLGAPDSSTAIPRARLQYQGEEIFHADDSPAERWVRLHARVTIQTRSDDSAEGVLRAADLCQAAGEALLDDPYRGVLCSDLPIGRATEIRRTELPQRLRRPAVEIIFYVRCHFEVQEAV